MSGRSQYVMSGTERVCGTRALNEFHQCHQGSGDQQRVNCRFPLSETLHFVTLHGSCSFLFVENLLRHQDPIGELLDVQAAPRQASCDGRRSYFIAVGIGLGCVSISACLPPPAPTPKGWMRESLVGSTRR